MTWYFEGRIGRLGFGRRRTSIVETLNNDIILARTHYPTLEIFPMYNLRDLNCIRRLASDRLKWKKNIETCSSFGLWQSRAWAQIGIQDLTLRVNVPLNRKSNTHTHTLSWQPLPNICKNGLVRSFACVFKMWKVITKIYQNSFGYAKMKVLNYREIVNFGLLWRRKEIGKERERKKMADNCGRQTMCSCVWVATFWGIFMVFQGFLCTKCHQFTSVYHIFFRLGNIESYFYTILNKLGYFLPVLIFFVWSLSDDI